MNWKWTGSEPEASRERNGSKKSRYDVETKEEVSTRFGINLRIGIAMKYIVLTTPWLFRGLSSNPYSHNNRNSCSIHPLQTLSFSFNHSWWVPGKQPRQRSSCDCTTANHENQNEDLLFASFRCEPVRIPRSEQGTRYVRLLNP